MYSLYYSTPGTIQFRKIYLNNDYPSFQKVLEVFIEDSGVSKYAIDCACLAVAGPVRNNHATLTNKGKFVINGFDLAAATHIKIVTVINDFVGAGYGILTLNDSTDCVCIQVSIMLCFASLSTVYTYQYVYVLLPVLENWLRECVVIFIYILIHICIMYTVGRNQSHECTNCLCRSRYRTW